nr:MAG TPA: hypothetical protein [Caudoviricetes sp.]
MRQSFVEVVLFFNDNTETIHSEAESKVEYRRRSRR